MVQTRQSCYDADKVIVVVEKRPKRSAFEQQLMQNHQKMIVLNATRELIDLKNGNNKVC